MSELQRCVTCRYWGRENTNWAGLAECKRINHQDSCNGDKYAKQFMEELGATAVYSTSHPTEKNQYGYPRKVRNPEWDIQKPLRDKAYEMSKQKVLRDGEVDLAYCYDGSSYMAGVVTRGEFGCLMHEPLPEG